MELGSLYTVPLRDVNGFSRLTTTCNGRYGRFETFWIGPSLSNRNVRISKLRRSLLFKHI